MSGGSIDKHICTYDDDVNHHFTATNRNMNDDPKWPPLKQWLPLYNNTNIVQQPVRVETLSQTYVQAATSFMQTQIQNDTPFFLYMAFSHVHQLCASYHVPEQTSCQWSSRSSSSLNRTSTFIDALQEMDDMVGQILQALTSAASTVNNTTDDDDDDDSTRNNTIIIFTSDNGPWLAEQSCSGLRGPFQAQWYKI
jgi:arylsulfatase A-like enzyme